jgi:hypothetical protein
MKTKEVKKTVEQLAAEIVARKNVELFANERGHVGISYDDRVYNTKKQEMETTRIEVKDINKVDVTVYRGERGEDILYFVQIFVSCRSDHPEYDWKFFKTVKDVREAFAIKDMLDDMIAEFKIREAI